MNTITITFNHLTASTPAYSFGDRVAVAGDCQPKQWPQGLVVGLCLEEKLIPQWFYAVRLDLPQGFVEEYHAHELVPESFIPTLQAEWEIGSAA